MTITSLEQISAKFSGILLDAYGVFWGGNAYGVLPGSKERMEKWVTQGKIVGVLSNSTQLASKEIDKLSLHGLIPRKHFHFLITSGEVARSIFLSGKLPFRAPRHTFWLFGGVHPKFSSHETLFKGTIYRETSDIDQADFIYISIPHVGGEDQVDPEVFRKDVERIRGKNLPMVCANPDRFAHEGKPARAVVRQGSIAQMYEEMGGEVFYIGKPYEKVYSIALDEFRKRGIAGLGEILMIGDTPETDIRGARLLGISSALVTQTGIMADRISRQGLEGAIEALPDQDQPTYFISSL